MAVKIRLKRLGRRKRPFYRIVAIDSRKRRDGAEIERLGWYDPLAESDQNLSLNEDRIFHWLGVGAQPSKTVRNLFSQEGLNLKWQLTREGKSPEEIEAVIAEWEKEQIAGQRRKEAAEAQKKRAVKVEEPEEAKAEVEISEAEEAVEGEVPAEDVVQEEIAEADEEAAAEEKAEEAPKAEEPAAEAEADQPPPPMIPSLRRTFKRKRRPK